MDSEMVSLLTGATKALATYFKIKYLFGTVLAAYKDFGDRFVLVEEKLPAIEVIRKATMNKIGRFTK